MKYVNTRPVPFPRPTWNDTDVVHDDRGNMTTGPLFGHGITSYAYDVRNRLTSAGNVSYGYDARE